MAKASDIIMAGVMAGGGSGGGGGANIMIVHCDNETKFLDKTFLEIYNAMSSGVPVFMSEVWDAETYNAGVSLVSDTYYDEENGYILEEHRGNAYITDTIDGYPHYWDD